MESQLRLAERRGVLTGSYLSPVQEYALEMLMLLDMRDKAKDFVSTVRASMVAGKPELLSSVFSEWFVKDATIDGEPDLDRPEEIIWQMPSTAEDIAFVEEFVRDHATGTLSAAELDEGGGWE